MRHPMKKKGNSELWARMGVSFFGILFGMAMIIGMLSVMGKKAKAADGAVYDIANGYITIKDDKVIQDKTETFSEITITGSERYNPIFIEASANKEVVVTIKDLRSNTIVVEGEGNVTLLVEGANVVAGGSPAWTMRAGIQKRSNGKLTIAGNGTLEAIGSDYSIDEGGAGIGGGIGKSASDITITGNVTVIAKGGNGAAGIGGGKDGEGNNITISESATVTATGGMYGAGIGGGKGGGGSFIVISGSATVTATGGMYGAGIGGGDGKGCRSIEILGDAQVTATGGKCGAGIGCGDWGKAYDIRISDNASVIATGGEWGAGIGSGARSGVTSGITVEGSATVIAIGGEGGAGIGGVYYGETAGIVIRETAVVSASGGKDTISDVDVDENVGKGAAIGDGASNSQGNIIDGNELSLDELITSEFAGDIRYYQHGTTAKEIL